MGTSHKSTLHYHNQDTGVDITHVDVVQSSPVLFVQVCVCVCVGVLSSYTFFWAVPRDFWNLSSQTRD